MTDVPSRLERIDIALDRSAPNLCLDALRRTRDPLTPLLEASPPEPGPTPEDALARLERGRRIESTLECLSLNLRASRGGLRDGPGRSHAKIGRVLDAPPGPMKSGS